MARIWWIPGKQRQIAAYFSVAECYNDIIRAVKNSYEKFPKYEKNYLIFLYICVIMY